MTATSTHTPSTGTPLALPTQLLKRLKILMLASALTACANQQPIDVVAEPTPEPPKIPTKVADRSFDSDTLYALLVAEMAIDRKRYDIALSNYVQQSLTTRDPTVTARATQIARILRAHQPALEMSELWVDLEPYNSSAQMIATAELIEANRLDEAFERASQMLQLEGSGAFDAIAAKAVEGDIQTSRELCESYQTLLVDHPNNEALLIGYSLLLKHDKRDQEALTAINRVLSNDPSNIRAAFQETSILQQMGKQDLALEKLSKLVAAHPNNVLLRARYAQVIAASNPEESRRQFEFLHQRSPNDAEILFSLAVVENQLGHLQSAEKHFRSLLEMGFYMSSSHFNLGDINEKNNSNDAALEHYKRVAEGHYFLPAISRATNILVNEGRALDALELVRTQRKKVQGNYREGLYLLESDIMSGAGQMKAAQLVLSDGLQEFPESTRLLYARAMLYTRIDYIAGAEQDLKQLIGLSPDHAAALNALGYTLADRTDRLDEAYRYIQKAYELTPDDPAVIDSLGWIQFRMGKLDSALVNLRKAMKVMPDHEIAAHLGEVLWVTGTKDEAHAVWQQGLQLQPDSTIIHETLHRLKVDINAH